MKDFKQIVQIFLEEHFNFTTPQSVIDAVTKGNAGVKINQAYKKNPATLSAPLTTFFNKCNQMQIRDTTFGAQLILKNTTPETINAAVSNDCLYMFLKNMKKPWVKTLPTYQIFINQAFSAEAWQKFENEIMKEANNHGALRRATGGEGGYEVLYDDGTWAAFKVLTYEGEVAIAKDGPKGNEHNAGWCTRQKDYYNRYTKNGRTHLYIIRNFSKGDAYQIAFMGKSVEFFDSVNGEETPLSSSYSSGARKLMETLNKIPNKILEKIKDENEANGRTILDFKNEINKRMAKTHEKYKETWSLEDEGEKEPKLGPVEKVYERDENGKKIREVPGLTKRRILNYQDISNSLNKYFENDKPDDD